MNILELKDVSREEGEIFYIRKFSGIAVLELPTTTEDVPISFSIETSPFGQRDISVKVNSTPNYPVMPLIAKLKSYILTSDKEGRLPQ